MKAWTLIYQKDAFSLTMVAVSLDRLSLLFPIPVGSLVVWQLIEILAIAALTTLAGTALYQFRNRARSSEATS
jgi:hypothetical protein